MDFLPNPHQRELIETAQHVLDREVSSAGIREAERSLEGFSSPLWDAGTQLGWSGLLVDAGFGGGGHRLLDMCLLLEAVGRAGATVPLMASAGVAATMLQASPAGEERDALLRSLATGAIVAPSLIDDEGRTEWDAPRTRLEPDGDGHRLVGTKVLVPFAASASTLLVTAASPDGRQAIVAVDAAATGVTITRHHAKVGVPLSSVAFADVAIPPSRVISEGDDAVAARDEGLCAGTLLSTAEAIGWCEALIALTADYVTNRQAFGRAIGAFQAVAHPCADMRVSAEVVRILVHQAAWTVDNAGDAGEEVPAAKAVANEQFERVSNDAFRLHGAVAFSMECDVQLFTRRLQGFFGTFGETHESFERAAMAAEI